MKTLLRKIYSRLSLKNKQVAYIAYKRMIYFPHNTRVNLKKMFRMIDNSNLNDNEYRIHSQNGEDGIIQTIFRKIKTTNKYAVEFGIHAKEGNTILLSKNGWNCLWMDGNGDGLKIKKEFITAENINQLFEKYQVPMEFDLLSIDIDSNDYWIWKAITNYSPRLVIIEYNPSISVEQSKVVEYDPSLCWDGSNYYGASLQALVKLGLSKGYTLICCDSTGTNAFFIRDDLMEGNFIPKTTQDLYKPPQYGEKVKGKYIGHPPSQRKMIDV